MVWGWGKAWRSSSEPSSWQQVLALMLATAIVAPGCRSGEKSFKSLGKSELSYYQTAATEIDYPAATQCTLETPVGLDSLPPRTLADSQIPEYRDLTLEEVIHQGLANSRVMHELGGTVLRSPGNFHTAYDPAIQETDPALGVEAALSAFDAQFTTSLFAEKNDRALNNQFFGGGTRLLQQNAGVHQMQLSKRSVTGAELSARQLIEFDGNNAPGNLFPNAWTVKVEGEVRQPLLQGSGLVYNRIAGPTKTPGVYNGVLIARLDADVELTEFEVAVRDLVSNLENTYWDLYFAYRDLDAKIAARDTALDTWRRIRALYDVGRRGGEAEKEAQAREQYYRFQEEVENALSGRLSDGTRTGNGTLGGVFRPNGGVYVTERRLRRLMGMPVSDGVLLRPATEPVIAKLAFDWSQTIVEATSRRAELRRQKWQIRRRELELIASKNHLMPRLDAVGRYRWRGFGRDLIDEDGPPIGRFESAYEDLMSGDFQEWQLGLELDIPIGYRRAHAAVRHAELRIARERAILAEQQQEVIHDVAAAVAEIDRAYTVSQTSYNRLIATREQLEAVRAAFESDKASLDLLLDAQRRLAEGQTRYYRSLTEYAVAIKNVQYAKGTLLEFNGVYLSEGRWNQKAYADAADLEVRRGVPRQLNYASSLAPVVSRGDYDQHRRQRIESTAIVPAQLPEATAKPVPPTATQAKPRLEPTTASLENSSTNSALMSPAPNGSGGLQPPSDSSQTQLVIHHTSAIGIPQASQANYAETVLPSLGKSHERRASEIVVRLPAPSSE